MLRLILLALMPSYCDPVASSCLILPLKSLSMSSRLLPLESCCNLLYGIRTFVYCHTALRLIEWSSRNRSAVYTAILHPFSGFVKGFFNISLIIFFEVDASLRFSLATCGNRNSFVCIYRPQPPAPSPKFGRRGANYSPSQVWERAGVRASAVYLQGISGSWRGTTICMKSRARTTFGKRACVSASSSASREPPSTS